MWSSRTVDELHGASTDTATRLELGPLGLGALRGPPSAEETLHQSKRHGGNPGLSQPGPSQRLPTCCKHGVHGKRE